jgi:hypothetical protein
MRICIAVLAAALFSVCRHSAAQYVVESTSFNGAGGKSSGGGFENVSAIGQPSGAAQASVNGFSSEVGFLTTFVLKPGLDTDGDGVPDEVDVDNDEDGLVDGAELDGSSFQPATPTLVNFPDTDGDGELDGAEARAGTNPTDPNARLKLLAITNSPSGRRLAWLARGNFEKTYVVRATADPRLPYNTVVFSNRVAGGFAPWFSVTTSVTHASASNALFYAVEVQP